jgi:hypothetical protein
MSTKIPNELELVDKKVPTNGKGVGARFHQASIGACGPWLPLRGQAWRPCAWLNDDLESAYQGRTGDLDEDEKR